MEEKQNTRQVDSEANAAIFNHGRPNIASLPQCQAADKVTRSVMQSELLKTRNEPFTTEQILLIQHRYLAGDCWRELGIALGIDPRRLNSLKQNYKLVSERADQVLKKWIDVNGNDATVGRLACALIDIGKEEIVKRLLGDKSK